jgi:hypothetical protein
MASTSVHLPQDIVNRLDRLAQRLKTSRNSLIVQACTMLLEQDAGDWPEGFFDNDHLSASEVRELHEGAAKMRQSVETARPWRPATRPI